MGRSEETGEGGESGRRGMRGVLVTAIHATGTLYRLNSPQPKPISLLDFHTILILIFVDSLLCFWFSFFSLCIGFIALQHCN